ATGPDGTYRLRVPAGEHLLRASHAGYRPATRTVSVTADLPGVDLGLEPAYRLSEEVVVQAIRADARAPVTKKDIGREEIELAYHGQEVPFLLKHTPSITQYSDTGTGAGYAYLYLRGIQQTRINMTLDGVPLGEPEDSGLYFVNFGDFAGSVDSIQVQRGVGTSTVGAASYGGSINFASVGVRDRRELLGTLGAGSFGSNRGSVALHSGRLGPGLAFYGRASYQETDGFRDHSGVVQRSLFYGATRQGDRSFFKLFGFSGREKTQLAFLAVEKELLERDPCDLADRSRPDACLRFNPLSLAERDRFGQDFVQAQLTRALGASSSLAVQGYYNGAGGWYRIWDGPAQARLLQYELDWRLAGGLVTFRHARERVSLTAGAHLNDFQSEHGQRDTGAPLRNYANHGQKNEANGFVKLGCDVGRWHLYGDAQLRWARFRHEGDLDLGAVDWTFVNPKLGARYDLTPSLGVYASAGKATREPTRGDMVAGEDNPTRLYDLRAVRPERVWDFEAGLDYRTGALSLQANAYAMEFQNEIALTGELSEIGLPLRRNVDRSHRRGLELDAAWRALPSLSVQASANLSRSRIRAWTQFYDVYDADGAYLESVDRTHRDVDPLLTPPLVANLGLDWTGAPGLSAGLFGRYVAEAYLDNTRNEATTAPAFWNLDARLSLDLGRWLKKGRPRLRVQVNNVLDNDRIFPSGYSYLYLTRDPAGRDQPASIPYYYPLATRAVFVGLDLRL
ncbi:MAG TPA: TonB-dependent receptor, partial [Vicinamibacteria bacterium]|nr:TonB-dependent receptor [Vicinamibacteria bacterium]